MTRVKKWYVWSWRYLGWVEQDASRTRAVLRVWKYDRANHLWGYGPLWHEEQLHSLRTQGHPYG